MKAIFLFLAVPASFAVYFYLVTLGIFQKTAWVHFLIALLAIAGLVFLVFEKASFVRISSLAAAVALTALMGWWIFDYSEYGDAPELAGDLRLPIAEVSGLAEAIAGREQTELIFYRGYW